MAYFQFAPFHTQGVSSLNFTPDGALLCSTSLDSSVALWDKRNSGAAAVALRGHEDSVNCSAFFADGVRLVTAGEDAHAILWDIRNPSEPLGRFSAMGCGVNRLVLGAGDAFMYSAADDGCVVMHDVSTGEIADKFMVASEAVNDLCIVHGTVQGLDLLLAASEDKSVRMWLGGRPEEIQAFREANPAPAPAPEDDEELDEEAIAARNAMDGITTRMTDEVDDFEMAINHVHFDVTSGNIFAACANCMFEMALDATTGQLNRAESAVTYEGHEDFIRGIVTMVNAEGQRIAYTVSDDHTMAEWALGVSTAPTRRNVAHEDMIMALAASPCGTLLATGSEDSVVRVWQLPLHD